MCHSTGRGNRRSAESLYRSRGPQSWSHPGGLETAHSRPAFPCVKHIRYRRTHNSSSFPSVPHSDESGCSRETQIADCRLRNVTAASSHCVLTGNRTAFQFFVSQLSPFLVPPPHPASAFHSGHIYNQRFLFQQGEQIACSGSGIDWEVERQPQTGNTNSQNRL